MKRSMPHAKAKQDKKQSRTSARVHAYVRTRPSPGTPSINIVSTHKFTHRQGFAFPPRVLGILVGDARVVFSEHFSAHRKPHDADSGVHDQGGRLDATIPKRRERGGGGGLRKKIDNANTAGVGGKPWYVDHSFETKVGLRFALAARDQIAMVLAASVVADRVNTASNDGPAPARGERLSAAHLQPNSTPVTSWPLRRNEMCNTAPCSPVSPSSCGEWHFCCSAVVSRHQPPPTASPGTLNGLPHR